MFFFLASVKFICVSPSHIQNIRADTSLIAADKSNAVLVYAHFSPYEQIKLSTSPNEQSYSTLYVRMAYWYKVSALLKLQ